MNVSTIHLGADAMLAQSRGLAVIGNNIANSSSTGFKSNMASFAEQMVFQSERFANGRHNEVSNGVTVSGVTTNWANGLMEETGTMSHLAINGEGFLPVQLDGNTYYTRAGDFTLVETGADTGVYNLVLPSGGMLMGGTAANNVVTLGGPVTFTGLPDSFRIDASGVVAEGATVANAAIGLQRFGNPDAMERRDFGLYNAPESAAAVNAGPTVPGTGGSGQLRQGVLERSNVDLVGEFTDLIITQRAFQANARTISTANDMLQEVLNLVR